MNLGDKLFELRKEKHLSQEEMAEKLNVSRQTISKWETNQSTPDFDKILPLCKLYEITADELLSESKLNTKGSTVANNSDDRKKKKALGISIGILLYFIAVSWITFAVSVLMINPILASTISILICGCATFSIVYVSIQYKTRKVVDKDENKDKKILRQINNVVICGALIIYLLVSFITFAWSITWIIWIVCALIIEIFKLIFMLRSEKNEE